MKSRRPFRIPNLGVQSLSDIECPVAKRSADATCSRQMAELSEPRQEIGDGCLKLLWLLNLW